jgi:signal transduction histidine kinase
MPHELDFQLLFEQSPDVLLVLLPDAPRFTMVAATSARLRATMLTREQTIGHGLFEVFPDNPADVDSTGTSNLRASLERVLSTRAPDTMAVQKYDIKGPDGAFQSKYWSPKNLPVLSATGEVLYILHRVEDVTELVQQSEVGQELRDRTRQMERDVIARSRELSVANRELRDANAKLGELDAAKTAFFSNVSHEFRTPLTLILGPVADALASPARALAGEELVSVHRSAGRLMRLVNSVLDFSRIEAGRLHLSFAPTELAALTAGLAGSFNSLLETAGMRLVVDCPPLPEPVYVDVAHWEKIVLNLLSNAYKFTTEGEVAVRLRWCDDHVELEVSDTGTGIPEPELPRIFERFHRVEGARSRSFEGTGIGLSLVHELTQLHGGTVRVSSVVDRGTTFVVSIPTGKAHIPKDRLASAEAWQGPSELARSLVQEAAQWDRAATHASAAPIATTADFSGRLGTPGRVLVVDDNADMRAYLTRLLSPHMEVEVASNGKLALALALEHPPDLVLSDMMMPELDGVGLLRGLREDPRTQGIPFVLLSARAGDEAVVTGLETGADDYLVKPFSARELLTRVKTHLGMTRVRRMAEEAALALAETRAALVQELEAKNEDLAAAYRELQSAQAQLVQSAKMSSLGQLVACVAHEINNPLAFALAHLGTVRGSLSQVEAAAGPALSGSAQWNKALSRLAEMSHGLARIQELVLKLRTFSRLDEGERKRVSIRETVESVLTILGHRVAPSIQVATEFGQPDEVECFAGTLTQAIMNVVSNAIDAIDAATGGQILITTGADADDYVITVADTGSGIADDIRERVVEPFFTTKPPGSGTGLGLSITYSIMKKHGGALELAPRVGGGTTAMLRFPLSQPAV